MTYFLKFFTPIILIALIFFISFRQRFFFVKSKELCVEIFNLCLQKVSIAKLTKYSFIFFSFLKLSISLYVIALLFTPNSLNAFGLMICFLALISFVFYKMWVISKQKQEKLLFFTGQFFFLSIIFFLFALFGIFFFNSFSYLKEQNIFAIFLNICKNLKFNLVFAIFSVILFKIFSKLLSISLIDLKKNNFTQFSFLIKIFDFIGFFPKILYGLNCFFLNQVFNSEKSFFILALICSLNSGIFFAIQDIKKRFLNETSLNFYIIENSSFFERDEILKLYFAKNHFESSQNLLSYFWLFLNEITILIPVFFLSSNLGFSEFYSNFLIKIFEIFENSSEILNSDNQSYVLCSGLLFVCLYFLYLFFTKNFLKTNLQK